MFVSLYVRSLLCSQCVLTNYLFNIGYREKCVIRGHVMMICSKEPTDIIKKKYTLISLS